MADVMVTVMPFAGHVAPVLRATEALLAAGHRVRVYTGSAYTGRVRPTASRPSSQSTTPPRSWWR